MEVAELQVGQVIDFRGRPATVIDCWTDPVDAKDGFDNPAAAVIEWQEAGETKRCRLVWFYPVDEETGELTGEPMRCDGLIGALALWGG